MIKRLIILALLAMSSLGTTAFAAEQIELNCVNMPGCCTITCVKIDLDCCGSYCSTGALWAEFLDREGTILGTASFDGNWCNRESYGQLDTPVNSSDVCAIRLVKEDDCVIVTWGSLRVMCDDACSCKWYKVWKGDLWCWEPIPEPAMEEPQAELPPPVKKTPPVVARKPEPRPDFSYFPPAQPEPEPDHEVLIVIGRG